MRCGRPDCPDEIDDDGYCVVGLERPPCEAAPAPDVLRPPQEAVRRPPTDDPPPVKQIPASAAEPESAPHVRQTNTGPWWGLDLVPSLGARDAPEPEQILITDPSVPLGHWKCRNCRHPVATSHHGQSVLREGHCPQCNTPYSPQTYAPRLRTGEVVNDRYEIRGCVGQGGVGWVYAARDRHLDNRWVALKGLVDAASKDGEASVQAERNLLLSIDDKWINHQRIVRIQDSVFHPTEDGRPDFYLVMEYIRGYPLSDERFAAQPLENVVGCVLQILEAIDHLHRHGYFFCDLKPSNVMLSPNGVKLIDFGAVNSTWATLEFAAPELPSSGPSVLTDLYTVGRTLEVLVERWSPVPDALRHVIECATSEEPARRFGSAEDFADQLSGVLGWMTGHRGQVPSRLFAPGAEALDGGLGAAPPPAWWTSVAARRAAADGRSRPLPVQAPGPAWAAARLPEPHPDPQDPEAGFLAASVSADPATAAGQLEAYDEPTPEILLRLCRVRLGLGQADAARAALACLPRGGAGWRRVWSVAWHEGLIALSTGDAAEAARHFHACSVLVPGETAPQFAIALCEEIQGRFGKAQAGYLQVWKNDPSYEKAAFGLARVLLHRGERAAAVDALDRIPSTSPHRRAARIAAIRILSGRLGPGPAGLPNAEDLRLAAERLDRDPLGDHDRQRLAASVLESALDLAGTRTPLPDAGLLRASDGPAELRDKLEAAFRDLCRQASDPDDQTILIDLANSVRRITWW